MSSATATKVRVGQVWRVTNGSNQSGRVQSVRNGEAKLLMRNGLRGRFPKATEDNTKFVSTNSLESNRGWSLLVDVA